MYWSMIEIVSTHALFNLVAAEVACNKFECLRRETTCLKIQKYSCMYLASKAYNNLRFSAVSIQSGIRGMAACYELWFRKQMRAAIVIQVISKSLYKKLVIVFFCSFSFFVLFILPSFFNLESDGVK